MKILNLLIFFSIIWPYHGIAKTPIGEVRTVWGGEVDVYRNAVSNFNSDERERRSKAGITSVLFEGNYWESYAAKQGFPLYPGDMINTKVNTRAVIMLGTKRVIVGYNTQFIVNADDSSEGFVNMVTGKIRATISERRADTDPSLNIRTRSAVMGVRGTDFFLSYGHNYTQLSTIEGLVAIRSAEADEGQEVLVEPGQASRVRDPLTDREKATMSAEEIAEIEAETAPTPPEPIPAEILQDIRRQNDGLAGDDRALEELEQKLMEEEMRRLLEGDGGILDEERGIR